MINKNILVIAAHPDDEVLGCGGTLVKLINQGYDVFTLILGEGKTSRENSDKEDIKVLNAEIKAANEIIGVKKCFTYNFPDNRFDSVDFLEIVKVIEKIKNEVKPEIVFTHYEKDLNIDHQITFKAAITAMRPMENETVKEIYSFEILSSSEWNFPITFSPDTYFDITTSIENKINAMDKYKSELREFPHPRSLEGIKLNAKYWGMRVGKNFVEAFKTIRVIK